MQKLYVYKCIKTYIATTKSQGGIRSRRVLMTPSVLPSIAEPPKKIPGRNFDIFYYFQTWHNNSISHHTHTGKIVRDKILDSENCFCQSYYDTHTEMQIADSCLAIVTPVYSWSFANHFLDLVRNSRLQIQVRLWTISFSVVAYNGSII